MIYLPEKNLYIGDRIATWMFYLSEVITHSPHSRDTIILTRAYIKKILLK
jgi:hypothetical protein